MNFNFYYLKHLNYLIIYVIIFILLKIIGNKNFSTKTPPDIEQKIIKIKLIYLFFILQI